MIYIKQEVLALMNWLPCDTCLQEVITIATNKLSRHTYMTVSQMWSGEKGQMQIFSFVHYYTLIILTYFCKNVVATKFIRE